MLEGRLEMTDNAKTDLFKMLDEEWLPEICRRGRVEDLVQTSGEAIPGGERSQSYEFFTETHSYYIRAIVRPDGRTYLGCTTGVRKPRAGVNHAGGSDLPDGPFTRETWDKIVRAIVGYEMVPLYVRPPQVVTEEDPTGPSLGDPEVIHESQDQEPLVEQGPPQKNSMGHDFSFGVIDGYGACACGAHENSDACLLPCPRAAEKSRCCFIPCEEVAEWAVVSGPTADHCTEACTAHVGALLTDAADQRVHPIRPEEMSKDMKDPTGPSLGEENWGDDDFDIMNAAVGGEDCSGCHGGEEV